MLRHTHVLISSLVLVSLLGCGNTGSTGGGGGDGGGSTGKKRVFVTENEYPGDLVSAAGSAADGLAAGDALCTAVAQSAGLGGSWRAWLSSDTVNAIDRLDDVGPWYDMKEEKVVFQSKATIPAYPAAPGIVYTEHGSLLLSADGRSVWTGTSPGGQGIVGGNCNGWSSMDGTGRTGVPSSTSLSWTDIGPVGALICGSTSSLYCFEQ